VTAAQLSVEEKRTADESTLVLTGEIDMATADQLRSAAEEILGRSKRLVIDFAGVTFCDSQGLSALITIHRAAEAAGVQLAFVNVGEFLQRLLDITGLRSMFPVDG
jgi:anti-sigma B factor antagonist